MMTPVNPKESHSWRAAQRPIRAPNNMLNNTARAKSHDRTTRRCAPVVTGSPSLTARYGSQSDPRRNHENPGASPEKSNHAPWQSALRHVLSSSSCPRSSVRTACGDLFCRALPRTLGSLSTAASRGVSFLIAT